MKTFNKLFGMAMALVCAGLVTSCSDDEKVIEPGNSTVATTLSFVKAPTVKAWSGEQNLYGSTRAEGDVVTDGETETNDPTVAEEDRTGWPAGFEPARENVYNKGHVKGHDEVEVNLAVNHLHEAVAGEEEENAGATIELNDLTSKLSIHVRYAHDVKVRIPVPAEYLVPVDDMAIVLSHRAEDILYKEGVATHSVTMNVGGNNVTLNVALYEKPAQKDVEFAEMNMEDYANGYICVWTEGINQSVIDYCYETYGDGINFEVWNYFNLGEMTDEEGNPVLDEDDNQLYEAVEGLVSDNLFGYLNKATVEFSIDQNGDEKPMPDAYINAFAAHEATPNGLDEGKRVDCFVYIIGESALDGNWDDNHTSQRALFNNGYNTSYHLNGKAFNHIYNLKLNETEGEDDPIVE